MHIPSGSDSQFAVERSTMLLIDKPSISMGHLYHGYVTNNQRVPGISKSNNELTRAQIRYRITGGSLQPIEEQVSGLIHFKVT